MKKKILLLDDSLTVQKVVALSLDRNHYQIIFAKAPAEALKVMFESEIAVALVSESVSGLSASSFPKEVELRLGRNRRPPPMILITARPSEAKNYSATIQKPFTPQILCQSIEALVGTVDTPEFPTDAAPDASDDQRLQQIFNDAFPHESLLAQETLKRAEERAGEAGEFAPQDEPAPLWDNLGGTMTPLTETVSGPPPTPRESMSREAPSVSENLDALVAQRLDELLPGIVERLVKARLDRLLSEEQGESGA